MKVAKLSAPVNALAAAVKSTQREMDASVGTPAKPPWVVMAKFSVVAHAKQAQFALLRGINVGANRSPLQPRLQLLLGQLYPARGLQGKDIRLLGYSRLTAVRRARPVKAPLVNAELMLLTTAEPREELLGPTARPTMMAARKRSVLALRESLLTSA